MNRNFVLLYLILSSFVLFCCLGVFLWSCGHTSTETTPPSEANPSPTISSVNFSKLSIGTGETVTLTCVATDEKGDPLTYSWKVFAGTLSAATGNPVSWTAPVGVNNYLITAEVSDGVNPIVTKVATAYVETDVSSYDTPQIVYYMSQGNKIGGVLRRSNGTNLPAIIYTHGGSDPADLTGNTYTYGGDNILDNIRSLYGQSCVVLAAGNYGDQPFQAAGTVNLHGSEGPTLKQNFYKEILDAIAYVKRKDYVDPSKIALFGESRGGYNTVRALEKGAGVKVAAAWAVPATKSWCDSAITGEVGSITIPLLNLHHISDETVSISDGRALRDRFSAVFGDSYANYTYEELSQAGYIPQSMTREAYHPGDYHWTFTREMVWMTKTMNYFQNKGM